MLNVKIAKTIVTLLHSIFSKKIRILTAFKPLFESRITYNLRPSSDANLPSGRSPMSLQAKISALLTSEPFRMGDR